MQTFANSPFSGHLDVVATLRDRAISASIEELRQRDELTKAMRQMHKMGVSLGELSNASGLTVAEVERRINADLMLGEDLDSMLVG